MPCSLITSGSQMTKSCRVYFSFTGQIRTSKSRSARHRWPSTATSLESWTRFGRSESQKSAIRFEQHLPQWLAVLRRRLGVPHHHRRRRLGLRFLYRLRLVSKKKRVIFPTRELCGLTDFFPRAQARQRFVRDRLE